MRGLRKDSGLQTVCKRTCSGVTKVKPHHSWTSRDQDPLKEEKKKGKKKGDHESFEGPQAKTVKDQ